MRLPGSVMWPSSQELLCESGGGCMCWAVCMSLTSLMVSVDVQHHELKKKNKYDDDGDGGIHFAEVS